MKKILRIVCIVLLLGVMGFSGYKLFEIYGGYAEADDLKQELQQYKPSVPDAVQTGETSGAATEPEEEVIRNPGIVELQERNADVVGWITITDTAMDYPVVLAEDNQYYLKRDLDGEYSANGSIFMDYRCDGSLASSNTILYGHRMNDGSMFSDIRNYREQDYFDTHLSGYYMTPYQTYEIHIFAFLLVKSDGAAYDIPSDDGREAHLAYLAENATWHSGEAVDAGAQLITLSTCTYEFNNARAVIVGYLTQLP